MTPSPQPPRTPGVSNVVDLDLGDLPDHPKPSQALSDALVSIAARLLHLRSFEDGDPDDEVLRVAAVELRRIADTLTTPAPETRWPVAEGLD